jgi:hypothetical protein
LLRNLIEELRASGIKFGKRNSNGNLRGIILLGERERERKSITQPERSRKSKKEKSIAILFGVRAS